MTITSYQKITPGQLSEKTLDNGVMAIGRGKECDWILSDPERLISSRHCIVQFKDGRYYLTDCSTNGVELVNAGIRLRRGNSEPIEDGEVIRIGEYEILARINVDMKLSSPASSNADFASSFEALMGQQIPASPFLAAADPAACFQGPGAQDTLPDLFDFLIPPKAPAATQPDHVPADRHAFRPPEPLTPSVSPDAPASASFVNVIPEDWDVSSSTSGPACAQPVEAGNADPGNSPPTAATAAVAAAVDPAAPDDPSDLLKAFLRGAGLERLRINPAQAPAQMASIGRSYRLMVEGLIDVLRARSSLKGEFRMQQTLIRPVENNPLKFAPNADEALLLLLRDGNRAFLPPDQAIADSFDDLRAHQLAVMAGVEAAIKSLLKRFEPAELEARMGKSGALANFFGSRQAQNWQQFTELYARISREAEEDFQDLFGREFSRAYEAHSARLGRS
nr:type VI secretion system-associated FHA domain protein TagH [Pseudomonas sp. efr-133-TYG-103a]